MFDTALPSLLDHCHTLQWQTLTARQSMNTEDLDKWQETWADTLAGLHEFASHGYYGLDVQDLNAPSQQQAQADWSHATLHAQQLLNLTYTRGLPAAEMEELFGHVLHLWQEYAAYWRHANDTADAALPPFRPGSPGYPAAVELLCLPVLLDRQEFIPGIVQRLFSNHCDRLLDYLSAAACDKTEASEQVFCPHPYAGLTPFFEQIQVSAGPLEDYLYATYAQAGRGRAMLAWSAASAEPAPHFWAWEVAALVVLYGLDDSAFRNHASYPRDLVELAQQRLAISAPPSLRA